jgi:hypothetical protein
MTEIGNIKAIVTHPKSIAQFKNTETTRSDIILLLRQDEFYGISGFQPQFTSAKAGAGMTFGVDLSFP